MRQLSLTESSLDPGQTLRNLFLLDKSQFYGSFLIVSVLRTTGVRHFVLNLLDF